MGDEASGPISPGLACACTCETNTGNFACMYVRMYVILLQSSGQLVQNMISLQSVEHQSWHVKSPYK